MKRVSRGPGYNERKDSRGRELRPAVAYLKINGGLSMKEIAARLGIKTKTADHHWQQAKRVIRGQR